MKLIEKGPSKYFACHKIKWQIKIIKPKIK